MTLGDIGGAEIGNETQQIKDSPKLPHKDSPEKIPPTTPSQIQVEPEGTAKNEEKQQLREELTLLAQEDKARKKPIHPLLEKVGQTAHLLGARLTSPEKIKNMQAEVRKSVEHIRDRFGIRVDMSDLNNEDIENNIASVEKLSLPEAEHALKILQEELAKYPPAYIKFCNINMIRLVKGIMYHGADEEGKLEVERGYGRAPQGKQLIYLSTEQRRLGKYLPGVFQHVNPDVWENHFRTAVHHELFHKSDEAERGRFPVLANDDKWAALNLNGNESYVGCPGLKDKNGYPAVYLGDNEGFARGYGASNPPEDRATMAEAIMTQPIMTKYRTLRDETFYKKCDEMIRSFHARSGNQMGKEFFEDLFNKERKGKINETYWDKRTEAQWTPSLPIMLWLENANYKESETWIRHRPPTSTHPKVD